MCFRPAAAVTIVKCLDCGTFNKPTDPTCKKCGVSLEASKAAAQAAIDANAPARPAEISLTPQGLDTPKAPGAPAAPKAPGA